MRGAVTARYSAAGGSLADVARVERELATAERMVAHAISDEERAEESLRARFGLPRTTSLGTAPALATTVAGLDADAVLDYALEHRGTLEAGRASIAAARARALAAEARAAVPTFMFGAMYMQTPQAPAGLGLEIGMTLPWLWSAEPALAEAAHAEARAAEADVLGLERTIEVDVRTALAQLETTRRVLDVLRGREGPATALALDATAATYGAGTGTLLEWLDAARAIRELEIEETGLLTDVAHARVEVASAMGAIPGELDGMVLSTDAEAATEQP
jgi:outer membrane protein TolC